jgi:protein tyrosine/serine phosphatase
MTGAASPPDPRALEWSGLTNVRDLGGQPLPGGGTTAFGVALRADNVRNLTDSGLRALVESGVRRIVDLRWPEELEEDPAVDLPVEVVHISLFGLRRPESRHARFAAIAADVDEDAAFIRRLYGEYLEEFPAAFAAAIDAVAGAPGPVVFHCTAGKDRTGLVAALILRLAGVPIEAVAADYALTDAGEMMRRGLVDGMPEDEVRARRFLFSAPHDGMAGLLHDIDERYGSAAGYLRRAGLDPAAAARLIARLAPSSA